MNITNILAGLEKLVVEVLLWLLFIPRTLVKVVSEPAWVPDYVDEEMARDGGRFDNYMSPIPLFLTCSVVLFVIIDTVLFADSPAADGELTRAVNVLKGERGTVVALGFLCLPLLFSLATELWRGAALTRTRIERTLYIQCFYFSPLTLSVLGIALFDQSPLLQVSLVLLLIPFLVWFVAAEVRLIARERQIGTLRSMLVFVGCSAFALILGSTGLVLADDPSVADTGVEGAREKFTVTLPKDAPYGIVVSGFEGSTGTFDLDAKLNGQKLPCAGSGGALPYSCSFDGTNKDTLEVSVQPSNGLDAVVAVTLDGQPLPLPSVSREHLFDFLGILYILAISPALFRGLRPRRRASAD